MHDPTVTIPAPAPEGLRVGYVLKRYPRYSETFVVQEILAHERAGLSLDIFALRPVAETHFQDAIARVQAPVIRIPEKLRNAGAVWTLMDTARHELPGFWKRLGAIGSVDPDDLNQAVALALHVRQRRIGHLHAHFGTVATTVARLAAGFAGIGYSFTAHAKDIYFRYPEPIRLDEKIRDADAVVTISDFNRRHLAETFGASAELIYNGLDMRGLAFSGPGRETREIVAVGRLVEKKGFHVLVEACRLLRERGVGFTLRIIGAGPEEAALRAQIARSGLSEVARLAGPRSQAEVLETMRGAALLAAPCVVGDDGNRDGLPTVLLEAMAVGLPCVATDVTGIPELVVDGETGLIAPEGDPDALAERMAALLDDGALRARLARAGRARIERDFDIDANTARLRALFAEAAGRRAAAGLRGAA
jgi:colanic acid/amylovoran biosynthesis glycosyltransferase